jgi:cytochrome c oxidase subunit 2
MLMHWLPLDVSTFGPSVDHVFRLILYIVGAWFVVAEGAILYFAFRFRQRPGHAAAHLRGDNFRQLAWILVPALIVVMFDFGIDIAAGHAWEEIKLESPPPALNVSVIAERFAWIFDYPGPDGKYGTPDDYWSMAKLYVPVNQVVRLNMRSMDVIHSLAVPNLRLRQDVVPGRIISAWFKATKPGSYEIECTELCGFDHYRMQGSLVVLSESEYAKWQHEHWPSITAKPAPADNTGAKQ